MAGVIRGLVMAMVRAQGWASETEGASLSRLDRPLYFSSADNLVRCLAELQESEAGTSVTISAGQQSATTYNNAEDFLSREASPIRSLSFNGGRFNVHLRNFKPVETAVDMMTADDYANAAQVVNVVRKHAEPIPYLRMALGFPPPAVHNISTQAAEANRNASRVAWSTAGFAAAVAIAIAVVQTILR